MIDTNEKLTAFLPLVRAADWIAVDTEADSLHAYPEKICLIQISTAAGDRLVDPLSSIDLDALLDALNAHQLLMHGADYDLRLLRKHHEFVPGAIFDTMVAARLLGHRQFGLSSLLESFLNVKLDKGSQKANWARRPLTERMINYARNDTRYLKPLSDRLCAELELKGRLEWHQESCARLIGESSRMEPVDADSVWRVKGSHALNRRALAVLRELWRWREHEAVVANKPPFFILQHELMVDISATASAHKPVEPVLPRHLTPRRQRGVLKAVEAALQLPEEQYPKIPRHFCQRPTDAERRRFAELERYRNARAHELGIDPTLIASRGTLMDLARNWEVHAPELMNWQRQLLLA